MRRATATFVILFVALVGCSNNLVKPSLADAEKPDVFCDVVRPPAKLLMGTWECYFVRNPEKDVPDNNYVKYTLAKYGDDYGLYFYRTWKRGIKKVSEWKNWTVKGQEIAGEPQFGVRIFVQGDAVYFTIRGLKEPVAMKRVAN